MAVNVWKNGCFSIPFLGLSHDHPTVTTVAAGFTLEIGVRLVRNAISQHCPGGFASDHKSRAGHLFLLVRSRSPNGLYLQMLLAPARECSPGKKGRHIVLAASILLPDSQLWIDVDSASTCLYERVSAIPFLGIIVLQLFDIHAFCWEEYKEIMEHAGKTCIFLHVDSSRPWQLIALSVWRNAMPGSFASSSERSKLYEWTRTLHDRVATIVPYN